MACGCSTGWSPLITKAKGTGRGRRGGERRTSRRQTPAVDPRPLVVDIRSIGAGGDGVADDDGRPVYVPYTVPGDRVEVRPVASVAGGVRADILSFEAEGPHRVPPPCRHFGTCGGCALQHLDDTVYVDWKRGRVVEALARQGLGEVPVGAVVRSPASARRRATFAARRIGRDVVLGFNAAKSHLILDLAECPVLRPALVALLPSLRDLLRTMLEAMAAADVVVTETAAGVDLVFVMGREAGLDDRERLAGWAAENDVARVSWQGAEDVVEPIAARRPVTLSWGGADVAIPAGAFLQATAEGEAAIVERVLAATSEAARVADLYAGCGTIAFPLAASAKTVHAVEGEAGLVAAIERSAGAFSGRVSAEQRDLVARPLTVPELRRFDAVVFDPPRAGAAPQARMLAEAGVPTVVGVSCNPATFARDARTLVDSGYRLREVTPIDQFLWSPHVELVGVFSRDGS